LTFLSPLLLAGLLALAVPVLLHLLRRRETRSLEFPALRYLTRTTREQARIIRLRQLLLLALRLAALVLLSLAAARLVLPVGGTDHPPAGLVIIVDNGLTSSGITGEGRVLDELRDRALEALDRTGERDRVWILSAGEPWSTSVPLSPDEARARLSELEPTHVTPDLSRSLERAFALLEAGAPELREIIVLSDLQDDVVTALPESSEPRLVPVRIAEPPTGVPGNRGIAELQVSGGMTPRAGDTGEIFVRLAGDDPGDVVIRAYLDGQLVASTRSGQDGSAILPLPVFEEGWIRGRVEIEPDDLRADDTAFFAFQAVPPPAVGTAGEVPTFLEDALNALEAAGRIRRDATGDVDVRIVGPGAPVLPDPRQALVILPSEDAATLSSLNVLLAQAAPGWRIEAQVAIPDTERTVEGGTMSGRLPPFPPIRLAHRIAGDESAPDATELLTLGDGLPWLVRLESGGVPVLVLASPLTRAASDVPTSSVMVPLVDLLTSGTIATVEPVGVRAGDSVPVPEGTDGIRAPDGSVLTHHGLPASNRTASSGVYEFLDPEGATLGLFAVNTGSPASASRLTAEEAAERLVAVWPEVMPAVQWPDAVLSGRRGREVWRPLVAALLLVLLAEGWLASYGGRGGSVPEMKISRRTKARPGMDARQED
jgi:hypothetical protein